MRERELVGLVRFPNKLAWRIGFTRSCHLVISNPLRRECFQITVAYSNFKKVRKIIVLRIPNILEKNQ